MPNGSDDGKKYLIFGQDPDVLKALWANIISWIFSTFAPSLMPLLLPPCAEEEASVCAPTSHDDDGNKSDSLIIQKTRCISIGRPGGLEQLRLVYLKDSIVTVGYNLAGFCPPPFTPKIDRSNLIPPGCVILNNEAFSVNYADCCIRWGLYESAKKFVGWPIVPGFDIAGTIDQVGGSAEAESAGNVADDLKPGDRVFGFTLFGAYSSRVLVPAEQLKKVPDYLTIAEAASLPAVSLTALHALTLAGHFPNKSKFRNKSILIHSAAGGVGSMLVQMSKLLGLSPVVGVVGSSSKVNEAKLLGCDVVIDKSSEDLWKAAEAAAPEGYGAIMDANGVSTLRQSYDHLSPAGRLVVFGFHSNLPMGRAMLSPIEWIRMAGKMSSMPTFDPMDMVTENKSVLGFNLSFMAKEKEAMMELFDQIIMWLNEKKLRSPRVMEMDIEDIAKAHELIQSGKTVGKIVLRT